MLSIDGVRFFFDVEADREVLKGISFDARSGELISILGPNGSGKTTLLRCISATLKPKIGGVYIDGASVHAMKSKDVAKRFAFVEQSSALGYDLSVMDVVMLGRLPHIKRFSLPSEEDNRAVERSLEVVGIDALGKRSFDELSGGEKQKVLIALAIAQSTKILLLDEPTAHLDIKAQIEVMELLRKLCNEGKIVLMATHSVSFASYFSDRILLLMDGEQIAFGPPEEVIKEELIRKTFGVGLSIAREMRKDGKKRGRVHVICGGGTGASLLEKLYDFEISAGVVNLFDSDHEKVVELGAEIAEEQPFVPISEEAFKKNMELIKKADFVIVTGFPVGYGNMRNIEAAIEACKMGKKVLMLGRCEDFTNGKAGIEELERKSSIFLREKELLSFLYSM